MTRYFRLAALIGAAIGTLFVSTSRLDAQGAADQRASFTVGAFGGAFLTTGPGELAPPDLYGFGGRVTLGLSALTGEMVSFLDYFTLGGFYFAYPEQGDEKRATGVHYGGEIDLHFRRVPLAGILDPFLSFSLGAVDVDAATSTTSSDGLSISPGIGFRIPLAGRAELRLDGQYITVLDDIVGGVGDERTDKYFQFAAGLQVGF